MSILTPPRPPSKRTFLIRPDASTVGCIQHPFVRVCLIKACLNCGVCIDYALSVSFPPYYAAKLSVIITGDLRYRRHGRARSCMHASNHNKMPVSFANSFSKSILVWLGLVWFGLVWFGLVWFDLVWFGLVWFGLVWFGLVWIGLVWFGLD